MSSPTSTWSGSSSPLSAETSVEPFRVGAHDPQLVTDPHDRIRPVADALGRLRREGRRRSGRARRRRGLRPGPRIVAPGDQRRRSTAARGQTRGDGADDPTRAGAGAVVAQQRSASRTRRAAPAPPRRARPSARARWPASPRPRRGRRARGRRRTGSAPPAAWPSRGRPPRRTPPARPGAARTARAGAPTAAPTASPRRHRARTDAAGQREVQHAAEGVDVRPRVRLGAPDLLRRDVVERSHPLPGGGGGAAREHLLGQPEVGQVDVPAGVDQQVGGLDVAMDEARAVDRVERRRGLGDVAGRL